MKGLVSGLHEGIRSFFFLARIYSSFQCDDVSEIHEANLTIFNETLLSNSTYFLNSSKSASNCTKNDLNATSSLNASKSDSNRTANETQSSTQISENKFSLSSTAPALLEVTVEQSTNISVQIPPKNSSQTYFLSGILANTANSSQAYSVNSIQTTYLENETEPVRASSAYEISYQHIVTNALTNLTGSVASLISMTTEVSTTMASFETSPGSTVSSFYVMLLPTASQAQQTPANSSRDVHLSTTVSNASTALTETTLIMEKISEKEQETAAVSRSSTSASSSPRATSTRLSTTPFNANATATMEDLPHGTMEARGQPNNQSAQSPLLSVKIEILSGLESLGPVQILLPTVTFQVPSPITTTTFTLPSPFQQVQIQFPPGAWPLSRRAAGSGPTVTVFSLPAPSQESPWPGAACGPAVQLGPPGVELNSPIAVSLLRSVNLSQSAPGTEPGGFAYDATHQLWGRLASPPGQTYGGGVVWAQTQALTALSGFATAPPPAAAGSPLEALLIIVIPAAGGCVLLLCAAALCRRRRARERKGRQLKTIAFARGPGSEVPAQLADQQRGEAFPAAGPGTRDRPGPRWEAVSLNAVAYDVEYNEEIEICV